MKRMAIGKQFALKVVIILSLGFVGAGTVLGFPGASAQAQQAAQSQNEHAGHGGHGMQNCPKEAAPLPDALRGWTRPTSVTAAATAGELDGVKLTAGKAVAAQLRSTADMHYAVRPEQPGGKVSSGGMFAFDVPAAGTYRVMLGSRAWLDVVQDGKTIVSSGHNRGPACSGIGKMVDFPLVAGRAVIEVSGSGKPDMTLMVIPTP
ncbi:hypothetical protein [Acetobacter sp. KSO5]|uniref:hypothetical protein n=1 Tax=Acetobacter sp. KSO5 TaxID=3373674 RepID=UPI00376F0F84